MVALGVVVVAVFLINLTARVRAIEEFDRKLETYLRAVEIVKNEYFKKDLDDTKLIYGSIKGMLESLDDPYTRFMEPVSYKEMNVRMSGSYSGIGIYIGMKDKQLVVISPISGTPADKAGLKSLDKIMTIDSKNTKDMALDEAVSLIRGPANSSVKLGILRGKGKDPKEYTINREKIVIKSVESRSINEKVYYIKLNTFENQNAADEMEKAINQAKAKGAKGIVLDLRNNGGGLLRMAVEISSLFVDDGVVVYTVDREGNKETLSTSGRPIWKKPLVVVVNEASASASEILAGALRDNGVATLVGTHTFGKAYVQNVRTLDDGSAILLTVAKYFTPNGDDISKKGVIPDHLVDSPKTPTDEASEDAPTEIKEENDLQLKKAIEVLENRIGKKELIKTSSSQGKI